MVVNKKIALGICGSVSAIETPKIVRELRRRGIEIECVMTKASRRIIHPDVMEWASGNRVITKLTGNVEHVRLCGVQGEASLLFICPATANTISKIANGIDDTPVTTFAATAIGSKIPLIIIPAMHISMYKNPFVIENIEKLKGNGIRFIEPRIGENKAKLPDAKEIVSRVMDMIK
jgi:phosphopantothenoylcysteine decarboxylase/phosphopantothenate--cysteine ligase